MKSATQPVSAEAKLFSALLKDADAQLLAESKGGDLNDGIVFEGPSKAEKAKLSKEQSTPIEDSAGRSKYIVTRLCWCSLDAPTDCRFHSPREEGWAQCPNRPAYYDGASVDKSGPQPRKLWGTNPDFGKPRERESSAVVA